MQQLIPPSQHGYQNITISDALTHNKVYISKSHSFDSNSNPEYITDGEQYEILSSLKPTSHILPHIETLAVNSTYIHVMHCFSYLLSSWSLFVTECTVLL